MTKKIFAMFLAVLMVVSMLPTSAFADGTDYRCPGEGYEHTTENCTPVKSTVVAPTCTKYGYTLNYCTCGKTFASDPTEPTGHDYEATEGKAPTCLEPGYGAKYVCSKCGDSYTEDDTDALGHDFRPTTVLNCEEGGKLVYQCSRCDATKEEDIEPGEHTWGEWILSKKATAEEDGEAYRECEVCGAKQTVNVYYHDHVFFAFAEIPASCTENGVKGYYYCRICGEKYLDAEGEEKVNDDDELVIPATHAWTLTDTVAATCTEDGYEEYECTNCGATKTEKTDDATGHAWDDGTVTTAPTCTAKGVKTFACANCDATKTEDVDALGHTWNITVPSCKDTSRSCTVCDATETIEPGEHTPDAGTIIWTNDCVEDGTKVYKCTTCMKIVKQDPIDHDWVESEILATPSCTGEGLVRYECSRCGAEKTDNTEPNGHAWQDWVTVNEPDCTNAGLRSHYCPICSATDYDDPAPTGHEKVTITVEATCVTYAFTYEICTNANCPLALKESVEVNGKTYYLRDQNGNKCGVHLVGEVTVDEAAGVNEHNHAEFVETRVAPTCTTDGFGSDCCTACDYRKDYNATTNPELYKKTGHNFDDPDHWTIITANGCGVTGLKKVHCANEGCSVEYPEDIPALTHNYEMDVEHSTCQTQVYVCHVTNCNGDECGASYTVNGRMDRDDLHNWEIILTHYANHEEHIYYTNVKCTLCNEEKQLDGAYITNEAGEFVLDSNHVVTNEETGEVTPVTHWEYCNSCQEHGYIFDTLEDAKAKHTDELVYVGADVAVTCEASGVKRYHCPVCGYDVLVKNSEGMGHHFATAAEGGCLAPGTALLGEDGLPEDYFVDSTCTSVGYYYYAGCTVEGCRYYNEKAGQFDVIEMKDHVYDETIDPCKTPCFDGDTDAYYALCENCHGAPKYNNCEIKFRHDAANLCVEYSYLIYACGNCSKMHALYFYGNFGHEMVKTAEVPATYTEEGSETWECIFCDHVEIKVLDKLTCTHPEASLVEVVTVAPTCSERGYTKWQCSICGETVYTYTDQIPHTNAAGEVIDPLCSVEMDHICAMCGVEIIKHNWVFKGERPATCIEPAYEYDECSRCGAEGNFVWHLDQEALGHDWTNIETTEPTYESDGLEKKTCSRCGVTVETVLPMLTGLEFNMSAANANGREGYTYGSLIELTISLKGSVDASNFAFNVQIPAGLSFVEAKTNTKNFAYVDTTTPDAANENGVVGVLGWNLKNVPVSGEQLIVKLYFRVENNTAETYEFAFSDVKVSRKDAEAGTVDVSCNAFGTELTTVLFLDINGDGVVDTTDLFAAMDLYFDEEIEAEYDVVYDVNKDGEIDVDDIVAFRDYILGEKTIEELFNMGI